MHDNNRGLTLVEMLVTVSLMAAMMLISFPKVKDAMVAESVRGARRMVTTGIAQARGVAATRGCAGVLHVVNAPTAKVWTTACPRNGTGVDTIGTVEDLSSRFGVTVIGTVDSLVFSPSGVTDGAVWSYMTFTKLATVDTLVVSPLGRPTW